MRAIREFLQDWRTVDLLRRHGYRPERMEKLLMRLSDKSLWMAGHPGWPSMGYHFWKVRKWRGVFIAYPRVFWAHRDDRAFTIVADCPIYVCHG